MNRKNVSKFLVLLVISLFIVSYFPQLASTTLAASPEDDWVAHPMHIAQLAEPSAYPPGYYPSQIRAAYGLPSSGGAGTTIAIIDSYATPSINSDLTVFSNQFGLPPPSSSNLEVYPMASNLTTDSGWAQETCLDVEWAHAIAPDAKILLVEAKSPSSNDLLSAINYAKNRPDVVAVSMSWGNNEASWLIRYDSYFTSSYGAVFFASAGDSGAGVMWPASSPNVVAVGGTTLNLNPDGSVSSETAWSGSGGGISSYEPMPSYQTSYGLTGSKREVPDVSYNANPSTGVSVYYNSQWYKIGGTSAGAPQWAAIQSLGHSATNVNLYGKAKTAYASYFRDITSGSNGYNASSGYDLVTGLGSPLTYNFGTNLTISSTSGTAGGAITLNGAGFTAGSSANVSWLNPSTSTWTQIANSLPTDSSGNFTLTFNAPDLLQNSPAGDNAPSFNRIVFQAKDNSNGHSYNTTVPYTEWRRGLTQVGNQTAEGLYGNSTNLATTVFVQNGQSIAVAGQWFNPGTASLLWDGNVSLGTATIDGTGTFNSTVTAPTTTAGQHTVIVNDGASNFCVDITRLPTVSNNYVNSWHTSNVTVNLVPDYSVTETYYSINNGSISNVTDNGQPVITSEGSNNTLEYWSTWNVYGTSSIELQHTVVTGIELETNPPQGSIQINNGEASTPTNNVTLSINANSLSGVSQMRFSNDNVWDQVSWEPYTSIQTWQLADGDGLKTVFCQITDNAGLNATFSVSINLSTPQPLSTPTATTTATTKPNPVISPTPIASSTPNDSPTPSKTVSISPSATPQTPELNLQMILVLIAIITFSFVVKYKGEIKKKNSKQHSG